MKLVRLPLFIGVCTKYITFQGGMTQQVSIVGCAHFEKKYLQNSLLIHHILQILNDITGNLDAKKACSGAMKLHKKYLKKV
jgi:hypothetical protein